MKISNKKLLTSLITPSPQKQAYSRRCTEKSQPKEYKRKVKENVNRS